jgi:Cys-tRNA(Pro)/Cys-tRNA(Cys) deacylase
MAGLEPHPRVLAALPEGAAVKVWRHAELGEIASPSAFASAVGVDPRRVVKTVLAADRGRSAEARLADPQGRYAAAVLSFADRIALPALASAMDWSGCEMAKPEELEAVSGYPRFGVSPLGLTCRVFLDESLLAWPTVFIGAGLAGVELELAPRPLADILGATTSAISTPSASQS